MSGKVIFVLLASVLVQILGQPLFLDDKSVECYDRDCPSTTVACRRVIQTSDDKKTLNTVISCMDAQDMVLKDYRESVENPYGDSVSFKSTSFSGTYISHGGGNMDVNINNNIDPVNNLNVEDFS